MNSFGRVGYSRISLELFADETKLNESLEPILWFHGRQNWNHSVTTENKR